VTAIIAIRIFTPSVDLVKLPFVPGEGIAQPAGGTAQFFLNEEFNAISFSATLSNPVLPITGQLLEKAGAFLV
jgi:hypothetical protein